MAYSNADFSEHRLPYRNKDITLVERNLFLTLSVLSITGEVNFLICLISFYFKSSKIALYIMTIILAIDILFVLYGIARYATYLIRRILFHNQDKTECVQVYNAADSYCGHCPYLVFSAIGAACYGMMRMILTTSINKLMADICFIFLTVHFILLLIHIFIDADYVKQHNITTD